MGRLFGYSSDEKFRYLCWRVIVTVITLIAAIGAGVFGGKQTENYNTVLIIYSLVMMVVWGWPALKNLFGITAISALFTGNFIFGFLLFILYLVIAYLFGIIMAVIGTLYFIILLIMRIAGSRSSAESEE